MNMAEHSPLYAPTQSPPTSLVTTEVNGPSLSAFAPSLAFEPLSARQFEHALLAQALLEAQSPHGFENTPKPRGQQGRSRAAFLAAWSFAVLGATLGSICETNIAHAAPAVADAMGVSQRTDAASNQQARHNANSVLMARGEKTRRLRPFEPGLTRLHLPNPLSRLSKRPDFAQVQAQKQQAHQAAHRGRAPVAVIRPIQFIERSTPRTQIVQVASVEGDSSELASLPAAQKPVPVASNALPAWLRNPSSAPMSKIISVQALKLPSASKPLPANLRAAAVPADSRFISSLPPTLPRLAQNPLAPPLRRPERPVTNSDALPNQIEVAVGTFVVLLTNTDLQTVAVAEPNTADVAVVNARSVLVNGKTPGITSLVIVDRLKIRQYQVRVVPAVGTRPTDVAIAIGLPEVQVRQLRDALILEGEVNTPEEARRAVEVAGIYSSKVINQLTVRGASTNEGAQAAQIQSAINLPNVSVRVISIGDTNTTLLEGTVENGAQLAKADRIARALSKNVLNEIQMPNLSVDQVRESLGLTRLSSSGTSTNGATEMGATGGLASGVTAPGTPQLNGPDSLSGPFVGAPNGGPGFGDNDLTVRQAGDQLILEGSVPDQATLAQTLATAERTGLQVVNRLQIISNLNTDATFRRIVERAINIPGVRVTGSSRLIILEGVVPDSNAAIRAEQICRAFAGETQNLLQTNLPILVNVDVKMVEVNRTDIKNLGIEYPPLTSGGLQGLGNFNAGAVTTNGAIGVGTNLGTTFLPGLSALLSKGNARILSNPRTTVLSGRVAGFQAGGQVPIPSGSTTGQAGTSTTIVFKDFGALVNVLPLANPGGSVTMRISTEVSAPDASLGITTDNGLRIPGFSRRSSVTEVTIPPGGSISISGLIQNTMIKSVVGIPLLSKIPVLGALFTSKRFQNNQSEMIVVITPTVIANPLPNGLLAPITVSAGIDNPGTPTFGTGAIQIGPKSGNGGQGGTPGGPSGGGSGNAGGGGAAQ